MVITVQSTKLKLGYKQSEVGVIPEDWEVKKLSMITQFTNGKAHEQFIDDKGDYIVVNSKFISTEGKIAKYSKENLSPLFSSDIVMVMSDIPNGKALAKCFFVRENGKYTLNQRICSLRPYDSDSRYLFYKLNRNQYFLNFDSGVGQTNLKKSEILDCPVALPPSKAEQATIAIALSDIDALITSLDQLIAKKRDIKQATMQQLLTGKTRLPGFGRELKPEYKQTEIGIIPEDWEIEKLGDCLLDTPQYGVNAAAVQYTDSLPIYIRITDITDDGCFSPEKIASVRHASVDRYVLNAGDLVFARTGASVGKTYLYKPEDGILVFAGYLIRVKANPSKLLPDYLAAYVKTEHYWSWVRVMSMRSGQPGINGNEYAQLPIPLPSIYEQKAIAAVFSDMDAEIAALEQRREKTRAMKQGMMQELLTGKTRLL